MSKLDDIRSKLEGLGGGKPDVAVGNQKINSGAELKVDGRKNNKGVPGKAGRKPSQAKLVQKGVAAWIDAHAGESVDVQLLDKKTGKIKVVKMTRLAHALTKLYSLGTKGEGDADAINKWLDRVLGKPAQVLKGDADEPIRLLIDF